jgi:hypothetical protein
MRRSRTLPRTIVVAGLALALAGCGGPAGSRTVETSAPAATSPAPAAVVLWPAPPDPMERTVAAGLQPEPQEYGINHVHAHVDVFVDGKRITIPAGIGIDIGNPDVRTFEEPDGSVSYGGIEQCAQPCISPLHTHFASGIVHTESKTPEPSTLGQFFIEWGVALTDACVGEFCSPKPIAFYVDGAPYTGDPTAIELTDLKEIAIVIGTPPAEIPKTADFSKE